MMEGLELGKIVPEAQGFLASREETRRIFEAGGLEVLDNLKSLFVDPNEPRRNPGRKFVDDIMENPDVHAAVVKGPPGSGKSMIISQLRAALEAHGVRTITLFRDEVISEREKSYDTLGTVKDPRTNSQNWDQQTRAKTNQLFTLRANQIIDQAKLFSQTGQRTVALIEVVGLGRAETDRERSSLEELSISRPGEIKTLSIVAHPKVIRRNIEIREAILGNDGRSSSSDNEILQILGKYSVVPTTDNDDTEKVGKRIKELVGKMAPSQVIAQILHELNEEARLEIEEAERKKREYEMRLPKNGSEKVGTLDGLSRLNSKALANFLHGEQMDGLIRSIAGEDEYGYLRNIAFLYWYRSRGLENQEFIVYNDFLDSKLNWYIDKPKYPEITPSKHAPVELIFLRHANPQVYGEDSSPIDNSGILSTEALARQIGDELSENGMNTKVLIKFGDRYRHQQTAEVFARELAIYLASSRATQVEVADPEFSELMAKAEPLGQIHKTTAKIKQIYPAWIDGEEEDIRDKGIETPTEVREQLERFAKNFQSHLAAGTRFVIIGFTSETLPASVLKGILKSKKTPRIQPLTGVRVKIYSDRIEYEVGGKKQVEFRPGSESSL